MPTLIKAETWDGVTAPAVPTPWTQPQPSSNLVTDATHPRSSPNTLLYPSGGSGQKHILWADVTNGILADVSVAASFYAESGLTTQTSWQVFARYRGTSGASTQISSAHYYVGYLVAKPTGTSVLGLDSSNGSAVTTLGTLNLPSFSTAAYYRVVLSCNGTTISVQLQRDSDSFWLDNTGTWVSDPTNNTVAVSVTNSVNTLAGYAGLGFFASSAVNAASRSDDFEYDTYALSLGTLQAGTCYVTRASDTSLHVDCSPCILGTPPYTYQVQKSTDGSSWADFGSPQTGMGLSTPLTQETDTGLTTDAPYYYRVHQTDTAASPAAVTSNVASLAPRPTGRTYYLDPAGSDSNTGLATNAAWQTLAHAQAYGLTPGDSLLLKGGATFTGSLVFWGVPGTYAAPVTVGSYGTGKATISCGNTYAVRFVTCSGVRASDLIASGSGASSLGVSTSTCNGFEVINANTTGQLASCYLDNLEVTGCYSGIEIRGTTQNTTGAGSGYTDVRVTNCTVDQVLYFGVQIRCLVLLDVSGNAITWNTFSLVTTFGSAANHYQLLAGLTFTGVLVQDCHVTHSYGDPLRSDSIHSGDAIMVKQTQYGLIERCSGFDCGAHGYGPAGIWLQEATDCAIRWCEVARQGSKTAVDADGFDMDGGCVRCVIEYCYAHDNQGADYLCGPYTGAAAPQACVIRYCVGAGSVKSTNAAASVYPYGSAQIDIYNCLFLVDATGLSAAGVIRHGGGRQRMWNNILLTNRTDALPFLTGTFDQGSLAIGNLYYAYGSGGPKWNWAGINYTTLAAFLAGSGQGTLNGLTYAQYADPLLSAPSSHPDVMPAQSVAVGLTAFDQTASSPTVGAGLDLYAVYGIDPGKIDLHGLPNRAEVDLTHTGIDVGPTKYGTAGLVPGGGGGGSGTSSVFGCPFIRGV